MRAPAPVGGSCGYYADAGPVSSVAIRQHPGELTQCRAYRGEFRVGYSPLECKESVSFFAHLLFLPVSSVYPRVTPETAGTRFPVTREEGVGFCNFASLLTLRTVFGRTH